jgi:hypothetical protein
VAGGYGRPGQWGWLRRGIPAARSSPPSSARTGAFIGSDADAFIDDDTASLNVAILKQQQGFGGRIAAQEAVERFNGCLFAKPANGTPFFEAALLVNADIGRHDLHHIEMGH